MDFVKAFNFGSCDGNIPEEEWRIKKAKFVAFWPQTKEFKFRVEGRFLRYGGRVRDIASCYEYAMRQEVGVGLNRVDGWSSAQ
ncbi:hypothetical protein TNCT_458571 [Trichonephila clavata]|uniref:Uncharacterized protein n=1 Tax=Trichonephila clavata TaxID=2740835 RepID=A0A8X6HMZ4_TRICU|nr:hypothetical protein TNCT_458571 [Trichonephila clavata]